MARDYVQVPIVVIARTRRPPKRTQNKLLTYPESKSGPSAASYRTPPHLIRYGKRFSSLCFYLARLTYLTRRDAASFAVDDVSRRDVVVVVKLGRHAAVNRITKFTSQTNISVCLPIGDSSSQANLALMYLL